MYIVFNAFLNSKQSKEYIYITKSFIYFLNDKTIYVLKNHFVLNIQVFKM